MATPIANPLSSPPLIGRSNPAGQMAGAGSHVPITASRRGTAIIVSIPYTSAMPATK
jgi:hypothetical protein